VEPEKVEKVSRVISHNQGEIVEKSAYEDGDKIKVCKSGKSEVREED